MARERFVLLGLARPRAVWFREVGRWATSAAIPAEFLKCVSAEELRAHLRSGRAFSAVLLEGGLPAVDRDLIEAAREAGAVALVVDDGRVPRDWKSLGAAAVVPSDLDRGHLLDVLRVHARKVGGGDAVPGRPGASSTGIVRLAPVAAVTGVPGAGASVCAIALAQQLAQETPARDTPTQEMPAQDAPVLLADLCLVADQAMLHDARDIVPGVQELVEAHRGRQASADEVRDLTFEVVGRGYRLLLGLRRPRYWSSIRPRAFEAAFRSLRAAASTVVCDVTPDLEGEDQGGSSDVEERNLMARTAVLAADAVLVVGAPGVKGVHGLVRIMAELAEVGVPAERIVPVVNRAPRNPRARAEITRAVAQLAAAQARAGTPASPVFLPERKVDEALRDGVALPAPLGPLLLGAYRATQERAEPRAETGGEPEPVLVAPGSLGAFADQEEDEA